MGTLEMLWKGDKFASAVESPPLELLLRLNWLQRVLLQLSTDPLLDDELPRLFEGLHSLERSELPLVQG